MLIRFLLFMLSQWGWWCFFQKQSIASALFLPSLTACFQITVLILCGMVGLLYPGAMILWLFGLVYLPFSLLRKRNGFQAIPTICLLYLLCMIILVYIATKDKIVFDHDNFSHWATVLKEVIVTDRFLDSSRYLTDHFTYPLGSAVWVYFFAKFIAAGSEPIWMCGQALLMVYCIMPLFCYMPSKAGWVYPVLYLLLVVFLSNFFFVCNNKIISLMVDTLLPLVASAAAFFVIYDVTGSTMHVTDKQSPKYNHKLWYLIPYLCALTQIKSSGIFFMIVIGVYLLLNRSFHTYRRWKSQLVFVLGAPLVLQVFWKLYCSIHFAGMTAKHDLSLSYFLSVVSQKSPSDISTIFYKSFHFFLSSSSTITFAIVAAVVVVLTFLILDEPNFVRIAKLWGFLLCSYLLYALSTTGMYIFSMPRVTAMQVATIERYQMTMLIFCYYLLFCTVFYSFTHINFVIMHTPTQPTGGQEKAPSRITILSRPIHLSGKLRLARNNPQNTTPLRTNAARILTISCMIVFLTCGWFYQTKGKSWSFLHPRSATYLYVRNRLEPALKAADVPQRAKCFYIVNEKNGIYRAMLAFLLGTSWNDTIKVPSDGPLDQLDIALQEKAWIIIDADDTQKGNIKTWLNLHRGNDHIVIVE